MCRTEPIYAQRNYGIELLRLVAMFSIVTLHTINYGGVLAATTGGKHALSWMVFLIVYPAVDCFALISGYVGYNEKETKLKFSKFAIMWFQAFLYSFGFTAVGLITGIREIGTKDLLKSVLVITTGQYWYLTKYAALFFVMPWINKLIRPCHVQDLKRLIAVIFVVFSLYGTIAARVGGDVFDLKQGFSFAWLTELYIVGAWMKRNEIPNKLNGKAAFCIIGITLAIEWLSTVFFQNIVGGGTITSYTSPTVAIRAIVIVSLFAKIRISKTWSKPICIFSPAAFGVYLISTQNIVSSLICVNKFGWIGKMNIFLIPLMIFICSVAIFFCCLLMDTFRNFLFRLFRVHIFFEMCEKTIRNRIKSILTKVLV